MGGLKNRMSVVKEKPRLTVCQQTQLGENKIWPPEGPPVQNEGEKKKEVQR